MLYIHICIYNPIYIDMCVCAYDIWLYNVFFQYISTIHKYICNICTRTHIYIYIELAGLHRYTCFIYAQLSIYYIHIYVCKYLWPPFGPSLQVSEELSARRAVHVWWASSWDPARPISRRWPSWWKNGILRISRLWWMQALNPSV